MVKLLMGQIESCEYESMKEKIENLKKISAFDRELKNKKLHYQALAYEELRDIISKEIVGGRYILTEEGFKNNGHIDDEVMLQDFQVFVLDDIDKAVLEAIKQETFGTTYNVLRTFISIRLLNKLNNAYIACLKSIIKEKIINEELNGFEIRGKGEDGEVFEVLTKYDLFNGADMSDCYHIDYEYFDENWLPIRFEKGHCGIGEFRYPVTATTQTGKVIARGFFTDH
jgi:hypothetical protein